MESQFRHEENRQIRCCMDLNRCCPKNDSPLPNIDMLVDATSGHGMFSSMDGCSGYNQIRMYEHDASKIAFRTPLGNFIILYCHLV